ncbi:MAG TPA: tetratricopeptide repeat protein, partial [Chthonomonadales bacterium]|nr:tetratricopeptide repeat protein [Chthonomonadales bacterium]
ELLAAAAERANKPDYAIVNIRQAVSLRPRDVRLWRALAAVYSSSGHGPAALAALERAAALEPGDENTLRGLGELEMANHQIGRGYKSLSRAVSLSPQDMRARQDLGACALGMGRPADADVQFNQVIAHEPNNAVVLAEAAETRMMLNPSPTGLQDALTLATRAAKIRPTAYSLTVLGRVCLARRSYTAAVLALKRALALPGFHPNAHVLLSQAYAALGDTNLSRQQSRLYQAATAEHTPHNATASSAGP